MELDTSDPENPLLNIVADFDGADYYDDVNTSCTITISSLGDYFVYKGVTYYFPQIPNTIGGWEV